MFIGRKIKDIFTHTSILKETMLLQALSGSKVSNEVKKPKFSEEPKNRRDCKELINP
jgi:hypothetical protein